MREFLALELGDRGVGRDLVGGLLAAGDPLLRLDALGHQGAIGVGHVIDQGLVPVAEAVREQLGVRIPIIVDGGASPREVASTIIDLTDEEARWKVLREGAIPTHEISEFFAQG